VESARVTLVSLIDLRRRDVIFVYALFVFSFLGFVFLSYYFFQEDFFHLRTISYFEKARLAFDGAPPRLENVGFVYPPLPILIAFITLIPWLAQGLVSAFVYTVMIYFGFKFYRKNLLFFVILPSYLPFLYMAVMRFDIILLFFLISASTLLLLKYWEEGFSLYLFSAGFLFGIAFFIDFSVVYLALFYGLVLLLKRGYPFNHRLGVALVFLAPVAFFFGFTLFVNYVFKDDPFYFMERYYLFFIHDPKEIYGKADFYGALALLFDYLKGSFFLILPYLVGLFSIRSWREYYLSPLFLIYLSPILFSFFQIKFGIFNFSLSNTLIFLLFLAMFINRVKPVFPVYLAFVVSCVAAPFAFLSSKDLNEVNFAKAIAGKEFERNLSFYREVARQIEVLEGKVLMDDRSLYPTVLFVSDIKKLILPYRYEFRPTLIQPCGRTDYVVVLAGSNDVIYRTYPEVLEYRLDGCNFYRRIGDAFIFSCSPPCS